MDVAVVIEINAIIFDTRSLNIIFIPLTSELAAYQSYVYQTIVKGRRSTKEDIEVSNDRSSKLLKGKVRGK